MVLLVKLSLLVPLLAIAAANRSLVRVRLRGKAGTWKAGGGWDGRILRNAGAEVFLGVIVLLATSALTALPPAHDAFGPGAGSSRPGG